MKTENVLNKRYPLTGQRRLHVFTDDTEGFCAGENMISARYVTRIAPAPCTVYGEGGALSCECESVAADSWRTVYRDYEEGMDLSDCTALSVGANCPRFAPGNEYYLRLALTDGEQRFEGVARLLPEMWNTCIFTIGACSFRERIMRMELSLCNSGSEEWAGSLQIGGVSAGRVVDLAFEVPGAAESFSCAGGELSFDKTLNFAYTDGGELISPEFFDARNTKYNTLLQLRNTLFFVMENGGGADRVKISFITQSEREYSDDKSKSFAITPNSPMKAYFFNLSDVPKATGYLSGFKMEVSGGEGTLRIKRITTEEEETIYDYAGRVISCTSSDGAVCVRLTADRLPDGYDALRIYETAMYTTSDDITKMTLVYEGAAAPEACVAFPLQKEKTTRLSSQFLAVLYREDGEFIKLAPRFYIENYRDFTENIYEFTLPDYSVSVTDFGARADAFTDDTDAVQAAIDAVAAHGGGTVELPFYNTGRYIITNIMMKSNVELHFADGVVLWQSQTDSDYKYSVYYGHDVPMENINWTHALHVANYPLIQAKHCKNVKITGCGKIRSMDTGSEETRISWYPNNCADRIHCITIGFFGVENVELRDFEIVRANNYHMSLYASKNIYIANLRMHEVKCVSGDGIGFNCGSNHARIERCFFESNDDGVVLTASYNDPRGGKWWWPTPGMHNGLHDIEVYHSYFNSGGGKAIAFITWGTDDPNLENEEIENIYVNDCVLQGGYAVGTWPDNPYYGKVPFDNTETDDYSPVKNIRIWGNEYRSPTDLLCIKPTNAVTDCTIRSASEFQNGDFRHNHCYWTIEGDVDVRAGAAYAGGGKIYQGLYLTAGEYALTVKLGGRGRLFVEKTVGADTVAVEEFTSKTERTLRFTADTDDTYSLGIFGGILYGASIKRLS